MKIQITGPTDVTGDNARYTLELSELTPGDYTLLAGAWGANSSALAHLNLTAKAPAPTGPDASFFTQTPTQDAAGNWTCEGLAQQGFADWSDNRWFIKPDNDFPDGGVIVDASKALATGVFFTDPFGKTRRAASDPDAVRQYLEPGFFLQDKDPWRWIQYHPWGGPWIPARPIVSGVPYVNFDQYRSLEGGLDLSN